MTDLVSRAQVIQVLRDHPVFASIELTHLERLADLADAIAIRAGDALITEGEPAGDLFVLLSGRLQAWVLLESGDRSVVGEIGPGEVVGEMSMFSEVARSATVSAVRDCTLLRLPRRSFHDLIVEAPASLLAVTKLIVHRLDLADRAADRKPGLRTLTVVPLGSATDVGALAARLARELEPGRRVEVIDRSRVDDMLGAGVAGSRPGTREGRRLAGYLHDLEVGGALVMFIAEAQATAWTERCVRQADRLLLVGSGPATALTDIESDLVFPPDDPLRVPVDLVLVGDGPTSPRDTARWLDRRPVSRHHHVIDGSGESIERLARRLSGHAAGLVLSGGGARGFAHVGVIRAFREAGVAFDVVGGASFGASIAAQLAAGWPVDRIVDEMVRGTVDVGSLLDLTFPYTSLARGRTLTHSINSTFGEARIEDLPTEFYCVSSDLTAGRLRVHDRGAVAHAVRASVAIPGIFPPVRSSDGHVLVDGGIMDNLPVAEMRTRVDGGKVVAVDLRTRNELPAAELSAAGEASGWQPLLRRLNPVKSRMDVPRMIDLLIRSTEMASGDRHDTADVVLRPPLEGFGLLEFASYEQIIDAGYRYAAAMIDAEGADLFSSAPG